MPQIFPESSNTIARASLVGGILLVAGTLVTGSQITRHSFGTDAKVAIEQPIPFSHKHHANELGIDCRYCHTTVETSKFAGIPPTETCMSCHSQIWTNSPLLEQLRNSLKDNKPIEWTRVNRLPDFVYFDHSIHVNKGISCFTCHGDVQEMQLTYKNEPFFMKFCLDCHREPELFIRPKDQVLNWKYKAEVNQRELGERLVHDFDIKKGQLTDCWTCHR
ncbi:MAG: cytochrome c3 family protein [Armatimonadetes bacterium]|nr:cytochrome c3 family protein [Armatimonadota bacterium]